MRRTGRGGKGGKLKKEEPDDTPKDFVTVHGKMKNSEKKHQYDTLTNPTRYGLEGFSQNLERNTGRLNIPAIDKSRVKLKVTLPTDQEYINACITNVNDEEYIITQAPTQKTVGQYWRMIWTYGCKLMVCVIDNKSFSDTVKAKSINFFPRKEKQSIKFLQDRFTVQLLKKEESKHYTVYEFELSTADVQEQKKEQIEGDEKDTDAEDWTKPRRVTMIHYANWTLESWPDVDGLATCIQNIRKRESEIANITKANTGYIPPVALTSLHGNNRASVLWVLINLMKQCEKKETFDIESLVKYITKVRPGSFIDKLTFFVMYAGAFAIAYKTEWLTKDEGQKRVDEIKAGYAKL